MKKRNFLILIFSFLLVFNSCNKDDADIGRYDKVEIYLLKQYQTVDNSLQIDENSVVIERTPLIEYKDLLSYNPEEYTFKFSNHSKDIIKNMQHSVHGVAFAVVAKGDLIYTGYFWPSYSSATCPWLTIDPMGIEFRGEGLVALGYPGSDPDLDIPDRRNDPRIIELFWRDGKIEGKIPPNLW